MVALNVAAGVRVPQWMDLSTAIMQRIAQCLLLTILTQTSVRVRSTMDARKARGGRKIPWYSEQGDLKLEAARVRI